MPISIRLFLSEKKVIRQEMHPPNTISCPCQAQSRRNFESPADPNGNMLLQLPDEAF